MRRASTGRCPFRFLTPTHCWSLTIENVAHPRIQGAYDGVAASGMLRQVWTSTVGSLGSTNAGFTMCTGLAERAFHPFQLFRFQTMLLSSLGFPAK